MFPPEWATVRARPAIAYLSVDVVLVSRDPRSRRRSLTQQRQEPRSQRERRRRMSQSQAKPLRRRGFLFFLFGRLLLALDGRLGGDSFLFVSLDGGPGRHRVTPEVGVTVSNPEPGGWAAPPSVPTRATRQEISARHSSPETPPRTWPALALVAVSVLVLRTRSGTRHRVRRGCDPAARPEQLA